MKTFDTYAWVEYFAGTAKGVALKAYVEGQDPLYTPSVCLTELAAKYLLEGKDPSEPLAFVVKRGPIIPIDEAIARAAATYKVDSHLHTVDALIYAAARSRKTVVVSGDPHFKDLDDVEFLG